MLKKVFFSSYTVVGLIMLTLGLIIGFLLTDFPKIEFDNKLKLYEILNLFLTLCIAISIPFVIKKTIDDKRAIKAFLTDEVKETLKCLSKTKELINGCYFSGAITRENKDTIIKDFNSLELQINSLTEQLQMSFKSDSAGIVKELKETYFAYDRFVTGDELICENYEKIDASFHRDFKTHYNNVELQLKKLIHNFHCY